MNIFSEVIFFTLLSLYIFAIRFGGANTAVNVSTHSLHVRGVTGITSAFRVWSSTSRACSERHSRLPSDS